MSKTNRRNGVLKVLLEQGRKLELALVFDLMPTEQVEALSPENKRFAQGLQGLFKRDYPGWYGNASALIRQLAPETHAEFVSYFLANPKRKAIEPIAEPLSAWLNGNAPAFHQYEGIKFFNGAAIVIAFFANQLRMLEACNSQHESRQVLVGADEWR